jgi:prepilin-type N-terminal cleavage/methylation domain-containing protein
MAAFPKPTTRNAFSLLEMVVAFLVLGIVAAVAAPRFSSSLNLHRVTSAARRLQSDLTYARRCAIARSTIIRVDFDLASELYRMPAVASPDTPSQPYTVRLRDYPYQTNIVSTPFAGGELRFNRFGVPEAGGIIRLECGGIERSIALDAATGRGVVQ